MGGQICAHYGLAPSCNNRGVAHENGIVEAPHGHVKRRLEQKLILRGSCDFEEAAEYGELETSVLFELICHRYERKSLLVTSNQPFREWDDIVPSVIGIKGESYRQKAAAARISRNPGDPPTSLTPMPWRPRSTAPPAKPGRTKAATRKLAHRQRHSAPAANWIGAPRQVWARSSSNLHSSLVLGPKPSPLTGQPD
jgi:hypothetical protein